MPILDELTAVVLTYNERQNIDRTLRALAWVPAVLVLDSFSTDETCEIAEGFPNVRVVRRAFDTHTQQWNFGVKEAKTKWVLSLDADYEVSPALAVEIKALEPSPGAAGFAARFEFRIFGKRLRASVYPPRTVLFDRVRATYRQDGHTQLLETDGRVKMLAGVIYHDDRKPLSRWVQSQDRYAAIEARHLLTIAPDKLSRQDWLRVRTPLAPIFMLLIRRKYFFAYRMPQF